MKGIVYLSVWMYTVREMEDAIMDCSKGASSHVRRWHLFVLTENEGLRLVLLVTIS